MARVTVGPVIGKTTESDTRILLEVNQEASITCVLKLQGKTVCQQVLKFVANIPRVYSFHQLTADTCYDVVFLGLSSGCRSAKVKTLPANAVNLRVVCAACDKPSKRGEVNMYAKLLNEYVKPGLVDMMIHHGDQVYADEAFEQALAILRSPAMAYPDKSQSMFECYQAVYRKTWNDPIVAELLASVPNIMIWDDHEVRNDWGSYSSDWDSKSEDFQVALVARRAFWLYQRQLHSDLPDATKDLNANITECSFHIFGKVGVMIMDIRGCKTFSRAVNGDMTYYGREQMTEVEYALHSNGVFSKCLTLLVVQSNPVVYLSSGASKLLQYIPTTSDKLGVGVYPSDQCELLDMLVKWKFTIDHVREVQIVGGDLHYGFYSDIKRTGDVILKQIISSAISNSPPADWSISFFNSFFDCICCPNYATHYTVQHHDIKKERNFAYINLIGESLSESSIASAPKIESKLIIASTPDPNQIDAISQVSKEILEDKTIIDNSKI